jgi:hypothetical protein
MTPRRVVSLAAAASMLVLAACGSSGRPSTGDSKRDAALQFANCMRTHGVTNFPDPDGQGSIGVTRNEVQSPAFQAAQQACRHLLPNSGQPPRMTASERQAALRFAQCMRAHGESDFPDPRDPNPNSTGLMMVLGRMTFAAGPGLDPRSPAFRQAAERCGVKLPGVPPSQSAP